MTEEKIEKIEMTIMITLEVPKVMSSKFKKDYVDTLMHEVKDVLDNQDWKYDMIGEVD